VSRLSRLVVSWLAAIALLGLWLVPTPSQAVSKPTAKYATVKVAAAEGGTKITITGKNLKKVSAIYFGSTKTTKITHVSATKLKVTAPKHVPGTVKLKLRAGKRTYTTKLKITYVVTKISPTATEAEVLRLTNAARLSGYTCVDEASDTTTKLPAVAALSWNAKLAYAARGHSSDMAAKNYFSHTSKDGTTFSARITRAGYKWSAVGENIAAGYSTPARVVEGWLASYGHCKNLMSANFTELGVGVATGGDYGIYWTQDFGKPRS